WLRIILIALVFASPFFSVSLSKITLAGIQSVNIASEITPLYGEDNSATIFSIENYSKWVIEPFSSGSAHLIISTSKLILDGSFQPSSNPSAVSISRQFLANLTQYPIFYVTLNVSKGVSYGVRFDTQNAD